MSKLLLFCTMLLATTLVFDCEAKTTVPSGPRLQKIQKSISPRLAEELSTLDLELGSPIYIRIFKEELELELWVREDETFTLFRTYPVNYYGGEGLGPKLAEGDHRAPEGFYSVKPAQMNPYSHYHLAFNLGFPNAWDKAHKRTGSNIMVHGDTLSVGCFAMTDSLIEEIYVLADAALRKGQPAFDVHVFPFRMTQENMDRFRNSEHIAFWQELRPGYDLFEARGFIPPKVKIEKGVYKFE